MIGIDLPTIVLQKQAYWQKSVILIFTIILLIFIIIFIVISLYFT